jgi:hypothetical protein
MKKDSKELEVLKEMTSTVVAVSAVMVLIDRKIDKLQKMLLDMKHDEIIWEKSNPDDDMIISRKFYEPKD